MNSIFPAWLQTSPARHSKHSCPPRPRLAIEKLEERIVLDVTFGQLLAEPFDMASGKDLYVQLPASDDGQNAITFSVDDISDANVEAEIVTTGTNLRMTVSGTDARGQAFSGVLTYRLFDDLAPRTVQRIKDFVNSGFYDGGSFHRIFDNFVAQGGDPTGTGSGGSGLGDFDDEFHRDLTFTSLGLLAIANAGDDTNDSQFFAVDIDIPLELPANPAPTDRAMSQHLNFDHTIFGILTSGFETFEKVITTPVNSSGSPADTVTIDSVEVFDDTQNGLLRVSVPQNFTGDFSITVGADSGVGTPVEQIVNVTAITDTVNDRPFLDPEFRDTNAQFTTTEGTPITFTVDAIDIDTLFVDVHDHSMP